MYYSFDGGYHDDRDNEASIILSIPADEEISEDQFIDEEDRILQKWARSENINENINTLNDRIISISQKLAAKYGFTIENDDPDISDFYIYYTVSVTSIPSKFDSYYDEYINAFYILLGGVKQLALAMRWHSMHFDISDLSDVSKIQDNYITGELDKYFKSCLSSINKAEQKIEKAADANKLRNSESYKSAQQDIIDSIEDKFYSYDDIEFEFKPNSRGLDVYIRFGDDTSLLTIPYDSIETIDLKKIYKSIKGRIKRLRNKSDKINRYSAATGNI